MKDIEKRACDMKVAIKGGYVPESSLKAYFFGELKKQRKIDIEKACKILEELSEDRLGKTFIKQFKKAMEE